MSSPDATTERHRAPSGRWGRLPRSRERAIDVALGRAAADLVLRGGQVVDVHRSRLVSADIAIAGDRFAIVGDVGPVIGADTRVVDVAGLTLTPGLVTPHFHQWHSNHNPTVVAQCLLEQGTTALADGFYGPAIVSGPHAVRELADEFLATPVKLILLAPTHAYVQNRAAGFASSPGGITIEDLAAMVEWPICRGLEETFYDVLCDPAMRDQELLDVIWRALELGKVATGHGVEPESAQQLAAWAAAGISNDHEGVTRAAVGTRLGAGLHVLLRHGPGFANLPETAPALTGGDAPVDAFMLCNDIAWADTIFERGFDETLRQAIAAGIDPIDAVRMATILPARYYRVDHEVGAIEPGRLADLVAVSDLETFAIESVYADGEAIVEQRRTVKHLAAPTRAHWALHTMRVPAVPSAADLVIRAPIDEGTVEARVIGISDGAYLSEELHEQVPVHDGVVVPEPGSGVNLVALLERLDGSGRFGVGLVRGFGLERGAIASASNPLTQAVVAVAADSESLATAIAAVVEGEGAFVAVESGAVIAEFPTPLFGQSGSLHHTEARAAITELCAGWRRLGCTLEYPFAQLEFVAATSEPYLRISTHGLVRAEPAGTPRVTLVPVIVGGEDRIAQDVLQSLGVGRVTVRIGPGANLPVLGEALAAGVGSLRQESALDQMATDTVRWVVEHNRTLVIDDARGQEPRTPGVMIDGGLRSFVIAPIHVEGSFAGTVSVHSFTRRAWTAQDVDVIERAARAAAALREGEGR